MHDMFKERRFRYIAASKFQWRIFLLFSKKNKSLPTAKQIFVFLTKKADEAAIKNVVSLKTSRSEKISSSKKRNLCEKAFSYNI
jgi:hypothetical protein